MSCEKLNVEIRKCLDMSWGEIRCRDSRIFGHVMGRNKMGLRIIWACHVRN